MHVLSTVLGGWHRGDWSCGIRTPPSARPKVDEPWFLRLQDGLAMTQELHRLSDDLRVTKEDNAMLRDEILVLRNEIERDRIGKQDSPGPVILAWLAKEMVEDASREYFEKS